MQNAPIRGSEPDLVVFTLSFLAFFLTPEVKCLLSSTFSQVLIYLPPSRHRRNKNFIARANITHPAKPSASFVAMDFEEDQPLWGGSRQEEEEDFEKSGLAGEYEFPHHPGKMIVCVVLA